MEGANVIADSGNIENDKLKGGKIGVLSIRYIYDIMYVMCMLKPFSHLNNLFLHFLSFSKSQPRVRWSNLESRCNDLISKELYTSLPTSHQKKYEDFSNAKYGKVVFDNYTKMT